MACALALASPALAQSADPTLETIEKLQAQIDALKAQVDALKAQVQQQAKPAPAAPPPAPAPTPAPAPAPRDDDDTDIEWSGAPRFEGPEGFSFRPRGMLQLDGYYVVRPDGIAATPANPYGVQTAVRRVFIGADGTLPGGFSYLTEFNLTNSTVGYEDLILRYRAPNSRWQTTLGFQKVFPGLDELTSSRSLSLLERTSFVEAFGLERRIGVHVRYRAPDLTIMAGVFNEGLQSARTNDGWAVGGRVLWNPKLEETQLHVAINAQTRQTRSGDRTIRSRTRPSRGTDERYADSGPLAASSDLVVSGEVIVQPGPWWLSGELAVQRINGIPASTSLLGDIATNGVRLAGNPTFWGGYVEVGAVFTGERRGYNANDGRWDTLRVANPVSKGGWGALMGVVRLDYLDLSDTVPATRQDPVATGGGSNRCFSLTASRCFIEGGTQLGLHGNLAWLPTSNTRLILQYSWFDVQNVPANFGNTGLSVPRAFTDPNPGPAGRRLRDYSLHTLGVRAQIDW
jgi:phosphate-selective porin OprO/OprP